ncbi:hypothetical protein PPACK8108_LOCUS4124 [Phakopsora pachyrhizi]|uniref:Uncharacterized protein n=1 Tax=Phakopsora pachyrhizi TaxID=170000 RepID=A0AAV0AQ78_PHAPC|nr:hypothetical protein PPACK8108_LOCUS4124 [Phakopsora pachyrhizi]
MGRSLTYLKNILIIRLFHKEVVSQEEDEKGVTRFYCWHIDAALYDLNPPKVTTLQALRICRYNKGTGDQLDVLLGTTAFESRDQLPSFEESKIKTFPLLWKNPEFSTQSLERLRRTRTEPSGNATWPLAMNLLDLRLMIFKDLSEHL